jgi:hypothetical protein
MKVIIHFKNDKIELYDNVNGINFTTNGAELNIIWLARAMTKKFKTIDIKQVYVDNDLYYSEELNKELNKVKQSEYFDTEELKKLKTETKQVFDEFKKNINYVCEKNISLHEKVNLQRSMLFDNECFKNHYSVERKTIKIGQVHNQIISLLRTITKHLEEVEESVSAMENSFLPGM